MKKSARNILYIFVGIFGAIFVAFINFQIISTWIGKSGPANLGSIEVSYVSMGRFLRDFGFASWAPFWYLGFPFHLFYTPLLPFLEFLLNGILGLDFWQGYRLVTGISYLLVPVSVFFLGWQLSRKFVGGLISGVLYSVGPTVFYFILPATSTSARGEVAADRISVDFWDPRRFTILQRWGEGPHTLSLVFVPLAGVFFARLIKSRKIADLVLTAVFLVLSALSNALGLFAAVLLILSIAFVSYAQKKKTQKRVVRSFMFTGLLSFGLASFWYNLSFVTSFFGEGGGILKRYLSLFPWGWLAVLLVAFFFYWFFKRVVKNFGIAVSLVWFTIMFSVVAVYYFSAPPQFSEQRLELLPQALRYTTEVDLALSLLIGVSIGALVSFLEKKVKLAGYLLTVLGIAVSIALVVYIQPFVSTAREAGSQVVSLEETREKEIADWLEDNVDVNRGERVFLPGNYGFYLNWYTDIWQLRGGLFQAATHPWPEHIHYQMVNGDDGAISTAWLKVINAKYAVITEPGSRELYKEIQNFDRFEGLEKVYSESNDAIYKVPLKRPSLAKPVSASGVESIIEPEKADSKEELLAYIDWVENSSDNELVFEVIDHDNYRIRGEISGGEVVLVQMTVDSGWSAKNNGKSISKNEDPLGFLILEPDSGIVDITLVHRSSWKQWLGYATTTGTVVLVIFYVIRPPRKEKQTSTQKTEQLASKK